MSLVPMVMQAAGRTLYLAGGHTSRLLLLPVLGLCSQDRATVPLTSCLFLCLPLSPLVFGLMGSLGDSSCCGCSSNGCAVW